MKNSKITVCLLLSAAIAFSAAACTQDAPAETVSSYSESSTEVSAAVSDESVTEESKSLVPEQWQDDGIFYL